MSEDPSPSAEQPVAADHYAAAAEHARRAADLLEKARARAGRGEHVSAVELGKGACGHISEAYAHVAEAHRLGAHVERSVEREQGSHWNDADPGDSARQEGS